MPKLTYNQETEFMERVIHENFNRGQLFFNDALNWITETFEPEEVFDKSRLEAWAEENGYIKEES